MATLLIGGSFGGIVAVTIATLAVLSPPPFSGPAPLLGGPTSPQGAGAAAVVPPVTAAPGSATAPPVAATTPAAASATRCFPAPPAAARSGAGAPSASRQVSSRPLQIRIPAIGVSASVSAIGVRTSRWVQAPPASKPDLTGWYRFGAVPGDPGPAVILGNVSASGSGAVFDRLPELRRGNKIAVQRADGRTAIFTVNRVERFTSATAAAKQVYGNATTAALRLITCAGTAGPAASGPATSGSVTAGPGASGSGASGSGASGAGTSGSAASGPADRVIVYATLTATQAKAGR